MKKTTTSTKSENTAKTLKTVKEFKMPACAFCYSTCGSCRYYECKGWWGYCNYHERSTSSSNTACGEYC